MLKYQPDAAILTCYFNPLGYRSRLYNFNVFYDALQSQGADVHVIECRMCDDEWQLPNLPNLHRVEVNSVLWHKERLLNILIEQLPAKYGYVAWVDCDILFTSPTWVADMVNILNKTPVAQLFTEVQFLDINRKIAKWDLGNARVLGLPEIECNGWDRNESLAYTSEKYQSPSPAAYPQSYHNLDRDGKRWRWKNPNDPDGKGKLGHPGFGWSARREILQETNGLWDKHVFCSGDSVMAGGWFGWFSDKNDYTEEGGHFCLGKERIFYHNNSVNGSVLTSALEWQRTAFDIVKGNVGYVPCAIQHLWHGTWKNRDYNYCVETAGDIMLKYDPAQHLVQNSDGCHEWSPDTPPELIKSIKQYFSGRREDG